MQKNPFPVDGLELKTQPSSLEANEASAVSIYRERQELCYRFPSHSPVAWLPAMPVEEKKCTLILNVLFISPMTDMDEISVNSSGYAGRKDVASAGCRA